MTRPTAEVEELRRRVHEYELRLDEEARHRSQLRTLSIVARDVVQLRDPDELVPAVVDVIRSEFDYDFIELFRCDRETDELVLQAVAAAEPPGIAPGYRQRSGVGIIGRVAKTGEPYLAQDTRTDPVFYTPPEIDKTWLRSELAVPLRVRGETVGVLNAECGEAGAFEESDTGVLQALADLVGVALENARLVEEARRAEREKLQAEKLATVGELATGLAHEVNNPLASVRTGAELLLSRIEDAEDADTLRLVRSEATRAAAIVRNLLDFGRPHETELEPVSVAEVLEAALSLRTYEHEVHDITLTRELSELPPIRADRHRLQQVFVNLLVNAEQAMTEQENARLIEISGKELDRRIEVRLRDTGPGIAPEHLDKIFDPFFTTKPVGEGTGLGLAVSYGIVRELGGSIRAEETAGRGATFVVTLPSDGIDAAGETDAKAGGSDTAEWSEPPASPEATVLFIDDEASLRTLVGRYLTKIGYSVELASNGEEAIGLLQTQRFDAVITDLKMPSLSGQELYTRLEQLQISLQDRFIFVSGDIVSEGTRDFLASTGCPYLTKPFELKQLARHIRRVVGGAA